MKCLDSEEVKGTAQCTCAAVLYPEIQAQERYNQEQDFLFARVIT